MLCQKTNCVVSTLPQAFFIEGEPRSTLLYNVAFCRIVENRTQVGDSLSIDEVDFRIAERRSYFIFDNLDLDPMTTNFVALLDLSGAADVQTYTRIEFERVSSSGCLWIAKHHSDFGAQLIDKNEDRVRF